MLTNRAGAHDAVSAAKALYDHTVSTGEANTGASCGQAVGAGCAGLMIVARVEAALVTTLGSSPCHAKACSTHAAASTVLSAADAARRCTGHVCWRCSLLAASPYRHPHQHINIFDNLVTYHTTVVASHAGKNIQPSRAASAA